jgi:DNA-binding transcriptional ArsR family regulator
MADLIEGLSPLRIEFGCSLSHSVLATASLLCAASRFEGLGDWLRETRARLPAELCEELCTVLGFPGRYQRFTGELVARLPAETFDATFDELLAQLKAIPDVHYQLIALRALARGASPTRSPSELLDLMEKPPEWAGYLAGVGSEVEPDQVAALVQDGELLKTRLIAALERFWQEAYAEEFEVTRSLMERSVARNRAKHWSSGFQETFAAVTGRLVPEPIADALPSVANVIFIPSCYVGPYVAFTQSADNLYLFYNCRSTPASETTVDTASMYPPLKALADETRLQILTLLQGQELYAQQIVEQLDISQPAVSRHLNLLAAAGVLRIRREGNARYYTVDGETLRRLADALRALA